MPKTYTPEQRQKFIQHAIDGLSKGTPLAVICREKGMCSHDAIDDWAGDDEEIGRSIARAREVGWDQIAYDGLTIVDSLDEDPASRRVRSDYRLKLLAKWDPKRYGDKIQLGSDPDNPLPSGFVVRYIDAPMKRLNGPSDG